MLLILKRGDRLVVATHNPGKLREFQDLLAPLGIEVQSSAELGMPEPVETGETFEDNAQIKAVITAFAVSFYSALADDPGLSTEALGGAARHSFGPVAGRRAARFCTSHGTP